MSKFKATQATVPKAVVLLASESRRGGVAHTKVPGRQNRLVDKGQSTTPSLSPADLSFRTAPTPSAQAALAICTKDCGFL